jgi:hypothetical protein
MEEKFDAGHGRNAYPHEVEMEDAGWPNRRNSEPAEEHPGMKSLLGAELVARVKTTSGWRGLQRDRALGLVGEGAMEPLTLALGPPEDETKEFWRRCMYHEVEVSERLIEVSAHVQQAAPGSPPAGRCSVAVEDREWQGEGP